MVERNPGLHDVAKAAREEAKEVLGADFDRFRTAVDRYVNAVEVADDARREWERLGRPKTSEGSMRQETEHPLIRTMERLDSAAMRFGAVLGLDPQSSTRMRRGPGRPVGAASAPERRVPPEVKLKAV